MINLKGLNKKAILKRYAIGAHPIIQFFMEKLAIAEIIGSYIRQDERVKLSVEKALCVLIHNILTSPAPLYEIFDWLKPLDETSLGLDPGENLLIQDDRIGKALESFYHGRHKDIFFRLALRAIKLYKIDCSQIHQDTTSITFSGKYAGWRAGELLTFGTNKDHRPDLKQLVLGMSIAADGAVPLVHQVYDGNQSDDRVHTSNHQRLRKLLGRSDFIYVADCKLATDNNLSKISACGGLFVSVMPRTWKEDESFRSKVGQGVISWKHLLTRPNNRKPDSKKDRYYLALGEYGTSKGYRLLWILSSQKKEQDAETRTRRLEKSLEQLRDLQARLNRYKLKTRQNIKKGIEVILKANDCQSFIDYKIHSHTQHKYKFLKKGRPKQKDARRLIKEKYFSIEFFINDNEVKKVALTDGVFPLITNLKGKKYSPNRILGIYKFQPFLEKRHSQIKTYQSITPVFLKKAERVVASLHVHVMSLMVATIIERQLRKAMKLNSIDQLPIYPEGKECPYPTMFDIVRLFRDIEKYEVEQGEEVILFPAQITPLQKKVLELLEVPISLYQ